MRIVLKYCTLLTVEEETDPMDILNMTDTFIKENDLARL